MVDLVRENPGLGELSPSVRAYVRDAISTNTRAAYQCDLRHFLGWGGMLPASDAMLADYLADHGIKRAHGRPQRRALRNQAVKPVFGQIKHARGFRQFLLHGCDKVACVWPMICTARYLPKLSAAQAA